MKTVHVAVAVIENSVGDFLIAQRANHQHMGGCWEFPGGKVDDGESPEAALVREIQEELGISISVNAFLDRSTTPVGDNDIDLACYLVTSADVPRHSTDHDELRWVPFSSLPTLDWAAPDLPAVAILTSPNYLSNVEPNS